MERHSSPPWKNLKTSPPNTQAVEIREYITTITTTTTTSIAGITAEQRGVVSFGGTRAPRPSRVPAGGSVRCGAEGRQELVQTYHLISGANNKLGKWFTIIKQTVRRVVPFMILFIHRHELISEYEHVLMGPNKK
ncbi:hypothetical protein E2C01_004900 [Portunus trituberculatus]|uniref:Uncharacterized protein n=1 Tax=Portunus trituberculatus TaxID=210409 RepID=A0A5B7CR86_PORTR|nr:hypothetical protein [Portunus trituberculatus]